MNALKWKDGKKSRPGMILDHLRPASGCYAGCNSKDFHPSHDSTQPRGLPSHSVACMLHAGVFSVSKEVIRLIVIRNPLLMEKQ
jgi:hypothetical protein